MHLTLLLDGQYDDAYLASVLGLFNIGIALAGLSGSSARVSNFERAQRIVAEMARDMVVPDDRSLVFLKSCFNNLDHYIGVQNKSQLLRATKYVSDQIESGQAISVRESVGPAGDDGPPSFQP